MKNIKMHLFLSLFFTVYGCSIQDTIIKSVQTNNRAYFSNVNFSPDNEKLFFTVQTNPEQDNLFQDHSSWIYNLKSKKYEKIESFYSTFNVWWQDNESLILHTGTKDYKNYDLIRFNPFSKNKIALYQASVINSDYSEPINGKIFFSSMGKINSLDLNNKITEEIEFHDKEAFTEIKSLSGGKVLINAYSYKSDSILCKENSSNGAFTIKTSLPEPSCSFLYLFDPEKKEVTAINLNVGNKIDFIAASYSDINKLFVFFDINENSIKIFDTANRKVTDTIKTTGRVGNIRWLDMNNFIYEEENEIKSYNIQEKKITDLISDARIEYYSDSPVFIHNKNKLMLIGENNSLKTVMEFKSDNFNVYNHNGKTIVVESFPDEKKGNIYLYNEQQQNFAMTVSLDGKNLGL